MRDKDFSRSGAHMNLTPCQCLILACGNTLRGDDGVGPWLAEWARDQFSSKAGVRCVARQQWTPDLAEEIAQAASVIFLDCAADSAPGQIHLVPVKPSAELPRLLTHNLTASDLMAFCRTFYDSLPQNAFLLTVGGGAFDLHEGFSDPVQAALSDAKGVLEGTVLRLLAKAPVSKVARQA
jgi:hydrogenase maturation protease